jgi:hypothetical protein
LLTILPTEKAEKDFNMWINAFKGLFDWCNIREMPVKYRMLAFFIGVCAIVGVIFLVSGMREEGKYVLFLVVGVCAFGFIWMFIGNETMKRTKKQ